MVLLQLILEQSTDIHTTINHCQYQGNGITDESTTWLTTPIARVLLTLKTFSIRGNGDIHGMGESVCTEDGRRSYWNPG